MSEIRINLPNMDFSKSLEIATVEPVAIEDEMIIIEAMKNKNNSLHIIVNATTAGDICFKPGDAYPNAMLGDCWLRCEQGYNDIIIEDISRFENRDGSVALDFGSGFAGKVWATAKRAGIAPVVEG